MASIFELQEELLHLQHVLEMQEDGEISPALEAWLTRAEGDMQAKVEGYCSVIGELEAMATARKAEARRIADLGAADAAKAERMRAVMREVFMRLAIPRMETTRYKVRLQTAGGQQRVTVDPFQVVPDEFTVTVTERRNNMEKIRQALEAGECLDFAELHPRQQILVIR